MRQKTKKRIVSIIALAVVLILILGMIISSIPSAKADDLGNLQNQYSSLKQKEIQLKQQLNSNTAQQSDTKAKIDLCSRQIDIKNQEINIINTTISALGIQITQKQNEVATAQKNIDANNDLFKQRMRAMYQTGETSFLEILLTSTSMTDFLNRMSTLKVISIHDQNLLKQMKTDRQKIQDAKKQLETAQTIQIEQKSVLTEAQNELTQQQNDKMQLYAKLKSDGNDLTSQLSENQAAEKKASDEITKYLQSQSSSSSSSGSGGKGQSSSSGSSSSSSSKSSSSSSSSSSGSGSKPGGGSASTGFFLWPIASGYSLGPGFNGYPGHTGIDIVDSIGTSIRAAASGTVIRTSYWDPGADNARKAYPYGNYLIIDHGNGIATLYAHCSALLVSDGQTVTRGQAIAKVGNTGNVYSHGVQPSASDTTAGAHLHFEVRVNGSPVDPQNYTYSY